MRYRLVIALALLASLAWGADGEGMRRTFTFQSPPAAHSEVVLEVHVGPLAPGQLVRVETESGEPIGTIAPFGPAARRNGGVYPLPVPRQAIRDGQLVTRVTITEANKSPRTPTSVEVQNLELVDPLARR